MKKSVLFGIGLALSLPLASMAVAAEKTMGAGIEATVQLPISTLGDAYGIGLGGTVVYEYYFNPMWAVTARAGDIYHLEKNSVTMNQVPVLVGAKYSLGSDMPLFFTGELGLSYMNTSFSGGGSSSTSKFEVGVAVGYPVGPIDIRINWNSLDVGHFGDSMEIGVGLAWNFWSM